MPDRRRRMSIWEMTGERPPWGDGPEPPFPRPALPASDGRFVGPQDIIAVPAQVLCDDGRWRFAMLRARQRVTRDGVTGWAYLIDYHAGPMRGSTSSWRMYDASALRTLPPDEFVRPTCTQAGDPP
ncbi:hypothetical protein DQ384_36740 [Sphaerisporangium album]|uniref:Uncharacterized protein n=1 Tax=Sphaerisporangium album TaxID=509200 RepID=A0A367ESZ1_9ACTN|nr:hypothetical protein [Sphaerisporangium album]RCG21161.1 hypothetical protein DQ384_36740 [Sphaerisporangium album]